MRLRTNIRSCGRIGAAFLAGLGSVLFSAQTPVEGASNPIPQIIATNGRHALIVDGAPYLILGAQAHNSSAWPDTLPKVWAAMDDLHANTLEIPVYWEQFEPEEGKFNPSNVDLMIKASTRTQCTPGFPLVWHLEERRRSLHSALGQKSPGAVHPHYRPSWAC